MTTTHTHTKGPWTIEAPSKGCAFPIIHGGIDSAEIAIIYGGGADTRLISAAPDMLDALELIHANAAESPEWIRAKIDSVIAKAKGGEA